MKLDSTPECYTLNHICMIMISPNILEKVNITIMVTYAQTSTSTLHFPVFFLTLLRCVERISSIRLSIINIVFKFKFCTTTTDVLQTALATKTLHCLYKTTTKNVIKLIGRSCGRGRGWGGASG